MDSRLSAVQEMATLAGIPSIAPVVDTTAALELEGKRRIQPTSSRVTVTCALTINKLEGMQDGYLQVRCRTGRRRLLRRLLWGHRSLWGHVLPYTHPMSDNTFRLYRTK